MGLDSIILENTVYPMSQRSLKFCYCCRVSTACLNYVQRRFLLEKKNCVYKWESLINFLNANYFRWLKLNETVCIKGKKNNNNNNNNK